MYINLANFVHALSFLSNTLATKKIEKCWGGRKKRRYEILRSAIKTFWVFYGEKVPQFFGFSRFLLNFLETTIFY